MISNDPNIDLLVGLLGKGADEACSKIENISQKIDSHQRDRVNHLIKESPVVTWNLILILAIIYYPLVSVVEVAKSIPNKFKRNSEFVSAFFDAAGEEIRQQFLNFGRFEELYMLLHDHQDGIVPVQVAELTAALERTDE